jgi:hypothetical protein
LRGGVFATSRLLVLPEAIRKQQAQESEGDGV